MQAVKLRPEELLGGPVRSDWLLLWRLLPRGLPNSGDAGRRQRRSRKDTEGVRKGGHIQEAPTN